MKLVVFWALALAYAPVVFASADLPVCLDKQGSPIESPNNEQVLSWKRTTQSSYLDRGYIRGTLVNIFDSNPSHLHLDVFLGQKGGPDKASDIEVIYNTEFGQTPDDLRPGLEVIACGDYITSSQQNGPYPASPLDAILHWVHKAMNDHHADGFLMIDGVLYGQQDAPPRGKFQKHRGGADAEIQSGDWAK